MIFTEDVMTLEEYERTPTASTWPPRTYITRRCSSFTRGAGDRLHGPLPHPGGGGLSGGGAPPLEYLAELVEANYQNYLRHSGEARFQDCFHLFFQDVKMGAVILNQDMTVLQTNKAAQEISQVFWEQYRHNQGTSSAATTRGTPSSGRSRP